MGVCVVLECYILTDGQIWFGGDLNVVYYVKYTVCNHCEIQ